MQLRRPDVGASNPAGSSHALRLQLDHAAGKLRCVHTPRPTSSARTSSDDGTVNPSALAVLRSIASWYFVGACAGRLAGFSPFEDVSHRGVVAEQDFDDHPIDGYHSSYIHSLGIRGRALAYGDRSVRSGLRKVGVGCVGGGDVLGRFCSETLASTRFISSWLALSSSMALMAFELSLAICCWFALSCSMFRSTFARSRAIVCSNCA